MIFFLQIQLSWIPECMHPYMRLFEVGQLLCEGVPNNTFNPKTDHRHTLAYNTRRSEQRDHLKWCLRHCRLSSLCAALVTITHIMAEITRTRTITRKTIIDTLTRRRQQTPLHQRWTSLFWLSVQLTKYGVMVISAWMRAPTRTSNSRRKYCIHKCVTFWTETGGNDELRYLCVWDVLM